MSDEDLWVINFPALLEVVSAIVGASMLEVDRDHISVEKAFQVSDGALSVAASFYAKFTGCSTSDAIDVMRDRVAKMAAGHMLKVKTAG